MWLVSSIVHSKGQPMRVSKCLRVSYLGVNMNPPPKNKVGDR